MPSSIDSSVVRPRADARRSAVVIGGLLVILLLAVLLAAMLGPYPLTPGEVIAAIARRVIGTAQPGPVDTVLFQIRLPRVAAALLVGAALAAAGASYQTLFRNPLVSPDILGVSAGAGFGAVLGILLSLPVFAIQGLGFVTGMITVGIVYTLARALRSQNEILVLVLAGIVVGALAGAGISLVKILADPYNQLPAITFWLLGSLSGIKVADMQTVAPLVLLGLVPLGLLRWRIGVLSLGDDEAKALGVNVRFVRGVVILAATLITATAVSVSGVIGWIGLVIPHMARLLVGPRYDRVLPVAALMGAAFLVLIDTVARTAARIEIPLGLLTALFGAPVFVWLLARGRRMWS
ncbi:FecCD family ABC transporter permease [Reyranella soli]|uniref:Iron ABC transporter permease n=1 Tax=Reyranella soli TaxID=1230389 RepID=A0A512NJH7_9HYPH|nr:iron ABC transporter permease [Reyranella soli]GEP59096.1 iron ABC transporter permease [Reyranella soli]